MKSDLHGPLAVTRSLGRLGIPVYIAGAHRRTPSSWSRFCRGNARTKAIVRDPRELLASYEIMQDSDQPNVMFQEFIPGGEDANWMFNGYFNAESDCLFGLTGKKLRQYRPYAGITSLGVCLPNPAVAETTISLMKTIGYRGALDIGFRFDARDGQYKVFDINPRIGCTFRLFVSDTGMDVARALYLDLTGQKIAAGNAIHGRKWIVEDLDLASSFRYWRDGKLSAKEWARSFAGIQEGAFFALDDPGPIVSQAWNDLREIFPRSREKQTAKTGSLQSSLTR